MQNSKNKMKAQLKILKETEKKEIQKYLEKLFGISKFQIYSAKRDGYVTTALRTIMPPVLFIDDVISDISKDKDLSDWRIWGRIPLVGKPYYWWFGGGKDIG